MIRQMSTASQHFPSRTVQTFAVANYMYFQGFIHVGGGGGITV